jgi:glutamate synthase domain-containing protein 3
VGAGMTGGVLYLFDEDNRVEKQLNKDYVKILDLEAQDKERLKSLIEAHHRYTESPFAKELLLNFEKNVKTFQKVVPK